MNVRKGETIQLEIHKMAYGGAGVGRVDGFVVFVRGGVPGDLLQARVYRKKKEYAEARILEVISPSPHRVEAPCPYSGHCGGCPWQHVADEKQLEYKREHVFESLGHIGGLKEAPVRNILPAPKQFGYRNKMEFSFSDRRWFLPHELDRRGTEEGFALGLHVPGTFSKVIDVEACLLQEETGNQILRETKGFVKESRIPPYGLKSHQGFWRFLTLRHSKAHDCWMVNVVTSEERPDVMSSLARRLSERFTNIETVVNSINSRKAAIAVGEKETVLTGRGWIRDRIGPFTFQISASSFFQTNTLAALTLYEQVRAFARLTGRETVLDLYSGTGTIPIFLSQKVHSVTGIEINADAVQDAQRNCQDNGIDNCRFICGDIRERLSALDERPDVLIIDPPRAGMHKDVLAQVMDLSPERVVYISCNPATLARDLGEMTRDYELLEIQPVDLFPHTYHVEAVAGLRARRHPKKRI